MITAELETPSGAGRTGVSRRNNEMQRCRLAEPKISATLDIHALIRQWLNVEHCTRSRKCSESKQGNACPWVIKQKKVMTPFRKDNHHLICWQNLTPMLPISSNFRRIGNTHRVTSIYLRVNPQTLRIWELKTRQILNEWNTNLRRTHPTLLLVKTLVTKRVPR